MKQLSKILLQVLTCVFVAILLSSQARAQETSRLYPVKFICGYADGRILAPGVYTTAVNIQNPNHDPGSPVVNVRKNFSIALPGETVGGQTGFLDAKELGPGEAYEIDCPEIFEFTREFCPDEFCKGFLTLEATAPLEVVSVYSAANRETESVEALHTDRTSTAEQCPSTTATVPSQTLLFIPPHVRGDREFDDHGPCVRFSYDLRTQDSGTAIVASYFMHAFECSESFTSPQSDFTAAEGRRNTVLFSASPGSKIRSYSVANGMDESYIDDDHADDFFAYGGANPVLSLQFTGDTGGDESGTETGVQIVSREFQVTFENCGDAQRVDLPEG